MLKVENLNIGYNNKSIVDHISFSIEPQEFTAILGLNGTGKTTLLKTISGLLKPIAGEVFLNDKDMLLLNEKELAKNISMMPQRHGIIYDMKVIDLVVMGVTPYLSIFQCPNKDHLKQAYQVLETMNMEDYSERNFLLLSEGEKQLIIMARSLMQNAQIMLFDEPVSSLDFINKHMVLTTIRSILKEQDKIGMITLHDPNLALTYCDQIIIINEGKIYAEFSTQDISREELTHIFTSIYGEISILKHENRYIIVR